MATVLKQFKGKLGPWCQLHNTGSLKPNDRCSCGSGKKFKRCCGGKIETAPLEPPKVDTPGEKSARAKAMLNVVGMATALGVDPTALLK